MFSEYSNPAELLRIIFQQTGSGKSKMAAIILEVLIMVATKPTVLIYGTENHMETFDFSAFTPRQIWFYNLVDNIIGLL